MYQKMLDLYIGWKQSRQKKANQELLAVQGIPQPIVQALEETVEELSGNCICSSQFMLRLVGGKIHCLTPGDIYPYLTIEKEGEAITVGYDWNIFRTGMVVKERFGPIPGVEIRQFPFNNYDFDF